MRKNINRHNWAILAGKKYKPPEDDGPTWIVGGILVFIGVLIIIFGE